MRFGEPTWGRQKWPSSTGRAVSFLVTVYSVATPHPGGEIIQKTCYNTCLWQQLLAPSLYSKKSFIFLKLTSSVLPFNFILMLDFGQIKKLGWTVAVPFAGSYEMTSKSFQPVPGCPDCQGRIYIL